MKKKTKAKIAIIGIIVLVLLAVGIVGVPNIIEKTEVKVGEKADQEAGVAQVLSGKTFTTTAAGVGAVGTLADYTNNLQTATLAASQKGVSTIDIPDGYYTNIQVDASAVYNKGVTDGKAALTGGNAGAGQILKNYTAYVNGSLVTGTMTNAADSKTTYLTSSDGRPVLQQRLQSGDAKVWTLSNRDGVGRFCVEVPVVGYYASGTVIGVPYSDVASSIGLTSDKIVGGNTILGITGTGSSAAQTVSRFSFSKNTDINVTATNPFGRTCKVKVAGVLSGNNASIKVNGTSIGMSWDFREYSLGSGQSVTIYQTSAMTSSPPSDNFYCVIFY